MLIRSTARGEEVLLGRRHPKSRFMPNIYAFPGGRVSRKDGFPSGFSEHFSAQPEGLDAETRRRLDRFVRAALRETFEETGLLVASERIKGGAAGTAEPPRGRVWAAFRRAGLSPAFGELRLVARAITPAISPLRFHTRFFLADGGLASGRIDGDGELVDIAWVSLEKAKTLPMAEVGGYVLRQALRARAGPGPAVLFRWVGTEMRLVVTRRPAQPRGSAHHSP